MDKIIAKREGGFAICVGPGVNRALRHEPRADLLDALRGLMYPRFWNLARADLSAYTERIRPTVTQHPYRDLTNSIVLSTYRNERSKIFILGPHSRLRGKSSPSHRSAES